MKILVIGAGKIGRALIENLIKENHEIFIVDKNEEVVNVMVNNFDVNGIVGDGLSKDILIEAGASETDLVICSTTDDKANVLCSVLAKKLGAKKTIARVRDPQCYFEINNMKEELGLDFVFNPELRTAKDIEEILKFPSAKSVESFVHGKTCMVQFELLDDNPIIGMSIRDVAMQYQSKILFATICRDEEVIIPKGDFTFNEGDRVYIIATESELAIFCRKIKIFKPKAKSVFIIGGGRIAYYLAKDLSQNGISVKIVEINKEICEELSVELPSCGIINGDGSSHKVLDEAGIDKCDAVVTLTGSDEENVIVSLYCQMREIDKVVTKVARQSVIEMINFLGLDSVVSPRNAVVNQIIKFVRANDGGEIKKLYKLNQSVEAIEFTVSPSFTEIDIPLKDLKIKKGTLIGGIVRSGEFILPVGSTTLQINDRVIIVTSIKNILELSDILK